MRQCEQALANLILPLYVDVVDSRRVPRAHRSLVSPEHPLQECHGAYETTMRLLHATERGMECVHG